MMIRNLLWTNKLTRHTSQTTDTTQTAHTRPAPGKAKGKGPKRHRLWPEDDTQYLLYSNGDRNKVKSRSPLKIPCEKIQPLKNAARLR